MTLQASKASEMKDIISRTATALIGYDEKLGTYAQVDYMRLGMGVPGTVTGYGGLYSQPYQIDKNFTRFISVFRSGELHF